MESHEFDGLGGVPLAEWHLDAGGGSRKPCRLGEGFFRVVKVSQAPEQEGVEVRIKGIVPVGAACLAIAVFSMARAVSLPPGPPEGGAGRRRSG